MTRFAYTQASRMEFPISSKKVVLQTQGVHLSPERFIFCFQADREQGQHVLLALAVS